MSQENENLETSEQTEEQTEVEAQEESTEEVDPLEAALAEAAEYKDKYLRAHADFENAKRRLEKDKMNAVSYANESFAKDILAVIDSFENALASIEGADEENSSEVLKQMKEGVNLTYEQLKKILEKNHIKEVECSGEFDPEVHQAIMQVDSDEHEAGDVVQVMQKGYTIKDRVLRPAMVSTCK
ncbi:MAG TPA: nucleotide exchange factor GrpE [Epsilonproteobacteria bacterium]|nr:nucleotide exchange factor GrpE [Campylobacterota bacterium]HHD79362.1 nucleotide exchange factor GrpE [Campylobacterota bacterium]